MAQFGRPSADTLRDNWEGSDGATTNLFTYIDEEVASDTEYVRTVPAPTDDVYVTKLSAVSDPLSSAGHYVRYRYGKDPAGGALIVLTVQLRQGYVNESSRGTLIASWTHNISGTGALTTQERLLSAAEADAITDYSNLYLRFVAFQ